METPNSVHPAYRQKDQPLPKPVVAVTWIVCDAIEPAWKKAGNGPEATNA